MQETKVIELDGAKAKSIWAEYQRTHDVSAFRGQVVGVDPVSGDVFIGGRASGELVDRLLTEGLWRPLLVWRVGFNYYGRRRERRKKWIS